MTNDTPPPGPAAAKTADDYTWLIWDTATDYYAHEPFMLRRVTRDVIEQAMAQAHAAGRDGGLEAAITLLEVTRMGAVQGSQYPADMIRAAQAGIRALRTASAQPTATEASERDG